MSLRRHGAAGFTLLELLIALAIVGALLAIAFGGLRMAISAWTRGDDRAEHAQVLPDHDVARVVACTRARERLRVSWSGTRSELVSV